MLLNGKRTIFLAVLCLAACGKGSSESTEALDGTALDVPLAHNALVYDPARNVYYASIGASGGSNGNRIATINPATGAVSYSVPVGSEPNPLAIADDGSLLYVGLDGTGDVVKLALPSMSEQGRTRLPTDVVFGQRHALTIAVSPADSTVIAVAMARPAGSSYIGLALLRDMVIQPRMPLGIPTSNLIAFDAAGTLLYALDTQDSLLTLNRIEVVADGFQSFTWTGAQIDYTTRLLSVAGSRVIAGSAIYDAPTLTTAGVVATPSDCVQRRSGDLLVCFDDLPGASQAYLLLADSATFVIRAALLHSNPEPKAPRTLVEGPAGQIAISYPGSKIRLFSSAGLLAPPAPPTPSPPMSVSKTADGVSLDIGIVHNWLAYDSVRNVYYASIPGAVEGVGNSIATINPVNGKVAYSAPVGSEPDRLAIAADASVLYVGLDGSGEVLRLALPSMTPQGRARLLVNSFDGISVAESIAVSPADASAVAVSMSVIRSLYPRSMGVALLRDMMMQLKRTTPGYEASHLVAFDSAGTKVYGLTIESSPFAIHRVGVLADGLAEEAMALNAANTFTRAMSFADGRAIAGAALFDTELAAVGAIAGATDCWPARLGSALLCLSSQPGRVLVADSSTLGVGPSLVYAASEPDPPQLLVQGPPGQIAISYFPESALPFIRLFSSAQLP